MTKELDHGYMVHLFPSDKGKETIESVTLIELWDILDAARENNTPIIVFKVGDCVLDWS